MPLRTHSWIPGRKSLVVCVAYFLMHVISATYFEITEEDAFIRSGLPPQSRLTDRQQSMIEALTTLLSEDGVDRATEWADAIVRYSPTEDLGYCALVTALIRRESHFQAKDLEWLYDRATPDLLHKLGLDDPVHTIGPLQIHRNHLRTMIRERTGILASDHQVKNAVSAIDTGVLYGIAFLDPLVREYFPHRRLRGASDTTGPERWREELSWDAIDWDDAEKDRRGALTSVQKMLSDLTGIPLVLDGAYGPRTKEAAAHFAQRLEDSTRLEFLFHLDADMNVNTAESLRRSLTYNTIASAWQTRYRVPPPLRTFPRLSHDPRVGFVFADFNAGTRSCRYALLQHQLSEILQVPLAVDGIVGPLTRDALGRFLDETTVNESRREDLKRLLGQNHKTRWCLDQIRPLVDIAWRELHDEHPSHETLLPIEKRSPRALYPILAYGGFSQDVKGIGTITVRDHAAASVRFFEGYYARLQKLLGAPKP